MDDERALQLVDELQRELARSPSGSLVPAVRLAVRIAHLMDEPEYAALFELHLEGVDKTQLDARRVTPWADAGRKPRWDPVQAFFQDRAASGGQVQGMPIERIEDLRRHLRADLEKTRPEDPGAAQLLMMEQEHTAILSRIANRVGVFANSVEKAVRVSPGPSPPGAPRAAVFVGHGREPQWLELKDFLEKRLKLDVVEFNRESAAGVATVERLAEMLGRAHFAFLVLTGEDRLEDGSARARENVIHEAGLFQGRLGFRKAIILLEDGCAEFSNIHGLGQIRFRKGEISACWEEVRKVLEREGVIAL